MPDLVALDHIDLGGSGTFHLRAGEVQELADERTRGARVFELPSQDGLRVRRVGCGIGPIHYRTDPFSEVEQYKPRDLTLTPGAIITPGVDPDWLMTANGWQLRLWNSRIVNGGKSLPYSARFSRGGATLDIAPLALVWQNNATRQLLARPAPGIVPIIDANQTLWPNAFGAGMHYGYIRRPDDLRKVVVLDAQPTRPAMTLPGLRLTVVLAVAQAGAVPDDASLASCVVGTLETNDDLTGTPDVSVLDPGAYAAKRPDGRACWWHHQPVAWDSRADEQGGPRSIALEHRVLRFGTRVLAAVSIPWAALAAATYPVYIDTDMAEQQVAASADDARNYSSTWPGDGGYAASVAAQNLCSDTTNFFLSGARFLPPIPQGATINTASLRWNAHVTSSYDIECYIACEDVDNAGAFAANTHEPYDVYLAATTARTDWAFTTNTTSGNWYDTTAADLSPPIQEAVSRVGWVSGNGMAFVLWSKSESLGAGDQRHHTWDETGNVKGMKLNVTYTEPTQTITRSVELYGADVQTATRAVELYAAETGTVTRGAELYAAATEALTRAAGLSGAETTALGRAIEAYALALGAITRAAEAWGADPQSATRAVELLGSATEELSRAVELVGADPQASERAIELSAAALELATRAVQAFGSDAQAAERGVELWGALPAGVEVIEFVAEVFASLQQAITIGIELLAADLQTGSWSVAAWGRELASASRGLCLWGTGAPEIEYLTIVLDLQQLTLVLDRSQETLVLE